MATVEERLDALEREVQMLRRQLSTNPPIEPRKLGPSNPVRPWEPVAYPLYPVREAPFVHTVVY